MENPVRRISIVTTLVCASLSCVCAASHAQSAAQWQARQTQAAQEAETIMRDANKRASLLAQFQVMRNAYVGNRDPRFQVIFGQYLSWYQSFIGNYQDAATSFSIRQTALPDDRPSPLDTPQYSAEPALTAIPRLARNHQAVFFNEAHNIPLTRTLTVELLASLRAEGFNYFAAETVYQTDTGLQSRGYPSRNSGFYTEEPICAEMVRTALKLGYKVIGYEALSDATGDAREAEQARNIYRQVFQNDPKAKLVVDAGYGHIQESGAFLGGASMAEHLKKLTHIDPLTVEQTMLYGHPAVTDDHPYYEPVMQRLHPTAPIVFVSQSGTPWSLRPGYDVSVWFPPQVIRRGRPTWLSLGGERKPYYVDGEGATGMSPAWSRRAMRTRVTMRFPLIGWCSIRCRPIPCSTSACIRPSGQPFSDLYLRPGKYRLTYSDANGSTLFSQNITVGSGAAAAPARPGSSSSSAASDPPCAAASAAPALPQAPCNH